MGNSHSIYDDQCLHFEFAMVKYCPVYREHLENEKYLWRMGKVLEGLVYGDENGVHSANKDRRAGWQQLMGQLVKSGGQTLPILDHHRTSLVTAGKAEKLIGQMEGEFASGCNGNILKPIQELRNYCQTNVHHIHLSFLQSHEEIEMMFKKNMQSTDELNEKQIKMLDLHIELHKNVIYVYEAMCNLKHVLPAMIEHQLEVTLYSTRYLEYVLHLFKENKIIKKERVPLKKYKECIGTYIPDYRPYLNNETQKGEASPRETRSAGYNTTPRKDSKKKSISRPISQREIEKGDERKKGKSKSEKNIKSPEMYLPPKSEPAITKDQINYVQLPDIENIPRKEVACDISTETNFQKDYRCALKLKDPMFPEIDGYSRYQQTEDFNMPLKKSKSCHCIKEKKKKIKKEQSPVSVYAEHVPYQYPENIKPNQQMEQNFEKENKEPLNKTINKNESDEIRWKTQRKRDVFSKPLMTRTVSIDTFDKMMSYDHSKEQKGQMEDKMEEKKPQDQKREGRRKRDILFKPLLKLDTKEADVNNKKIIDQSTDSKGSRNDKYDLQKKEKIAKKEQQDTWEVQRKRDILFKPLMKPYPPNEADLNKNKPYERLKEEKVPREEKRDIKKKTSQDYRWDVQRKRDVLFQPLMKRSPSNETDIKKSKPYDHLKDKNIPRDERPNLKNKTSQDYRWDVQRKRDVLFKPLMKRSPSNEIDIKKSQPYDHSKYNNIPLEERPNLKKKTSQDYKWEVQNKKDFLYQPIVKRYSSKEGNIDNLKDVNEKKEEPNTTQTIPEALPNEFTKDKKTEEPITKINKKNKNKFCGRRDKLQEKNIKNDKPNAISNTPEQSSKESTQIKKNKNPFCGRKNKLHEQNIKNEESKAIPNTAEQSPNESTKVKKNKNPFCGKRNKKIEEQKGLNAKEDDKRPQSEIIERENHNLVAKRNLSLTFRDDRNIENSPY